MLSDISRAKHIVRSSRRWPGPKPKIPNDVPRRNVIIWKRRLANEPRKKNCGVERRWEARLLKKKYYASRHAKKPGNMRPKKRSGWPRNRRSVARKKKRAGKRKNKHVNAPRKKLNCALRLRRKCARTQKRSDKPQQKRAAAQRQ